MALPWRLSGVYAGFLGILTILGPDWVGGDPRAALLPGIPGAIVGALFWLGRADRRRRVTMTLTTSTAGFLGLATISSLGALGQIGEPGGRAVLFQVLCLVSSALFLATTVTAWRRVNEDGGAADDLLRMYEEL